MHIGDIRSSVGLVRFFGQQDRDHSGTIEASELNEGAEGQQIMARYDVDGDHSLSPGEIMMYVNQEINASTFQPDLVLELVEDGDFGSLVGTTLQNAATLQGVSFAAGTELSWGDNGRIESATLTNGGTIQGMNFPAGTEVTFDENGHLSSAIIPEGAEVILGGESWTGRLTIEENGDVYQAPSARWTGAPGGARGSDREYDI